MRVSRTTTTPYAARTSCAASGSAGRLWQSGPVTPAPRTAVGLAGRSRAVLLARMRPDSPAAPGPRRDLVRDCTPSSSATADGPGPAGRCEYVASGEAAKPVEPAADHRRADQRHGPLRAGDDRGRGDASPWTGPRRRARSTRSSRWPTGLLRQDPLSPAGRLGHLRAAVRRPDRHRAAADRATSSPTRPTAPSPTPAGSWPWPTPGPDTNGSQFFLVWDDSTQLDQAPELHDLRPHGRRLPGRGGRRWRRRARTAATPTAPAGRTTRARSSRVDGLSLTRPSSWLTGTQERQQHRELQVGVVGRQRAVQRPARRSSR